MPKKVLMCPPTYFNIEYEINVWMHQNDQPSDETAHEQWQKMHDIYEKQLGWQVELITPVKGLPDMVFATDCCTIIGDKILLSNFRYPERQPETQQFEKWFQQNGYTTVKKAENYFEGGGDTIVFGDKIIAGHGFRSDIKAHEELREYFAREVISLRIVDLFFYHMDTSLAVLDDQTVTYYPGAIDKASQAKLKAAVPRLIEA